MLLPLLLAVLAPFVSDSAQATTAEKVALLQPICGERASERGCPLCPAGTDFPNANLDLRVVLYGHFLQSTSDDAVLGFSGCYSHAAGSGGALLLTRAGKAWQLVDIYPGWVEQGLCKKLPARDAHEVLACEMSDMHHGVVSTGLTIFDFGRRNGAEKASLPFFGISDSLQDCAGYGASRQVISGRIEHVTFTPTPDGVEIAIKAQSGKATLTESEMADCIEYAGKPSTAIFMPRLATQPFSYHLLYTGSELMPVAVTVPDVKVKNPSVYRSPDGAFQVKVPSDFRVLSGGELADSGSVQVCRSLDLICLMYPDSGSSTDGLRAASLEIARMKGTDENSCLHPRSLPGSLSVLQQVNFSQLVQISESTWQGGYWLGSQAGMTIEQGVYRTMHADACYSMTTNLVYSKLVAEERQQLDQELSGIAREFRFLQAQYKTHISPRLR